jgi:hypothetical protein
MTDDAIELGDGADIPITSTIEAGDTRERYSEERL